MKHLVTRYEQFRHEYINRNSLYSETDIREDFINPFFELLGWDVHNERNLSRQFREVVRETRVTVDEQTKRPDYEFRLGSERKFYVEAKKPNADIIKLSEPAFQIRRYGWSANLQVSILTNFEYLIIYDTTTKPSPDHLAAHSRLYRFHYTEYAERLTEIKQLISREAVYSGTFDATFSAQTKNRPEEAIDLFFLQRLNQWRLQLARDIVADNPRIEPQPVNELVERFILRVLFLRMCEDRGIQTYQQLRQIAAMNDWDAFVSFLSAADRKFDSGLFDTKQDPLCATGVQQIRLNSVTVAEIIDSLYFPVAPYTFAVFEPEFLGQVYDYFLHERIVLVDGTAQLQPKPENEGRDIVPTPQPLIQRIVHDTLTPIFKSLSFDEILDKKVIDPACGSGGFLVTAFAHLVEAATNALLSDNDQSSSDDQSFIYQTTQGWQLVFAKKWELLGCVYGVDRDYSAVEVARFSLLVKLLEDETAVSLPTTNSILPSLDANIVYGDSLVDERIYAYDDNPHLVGSPLTWGVDVPDQFDCVIGNPPYLKTEDIKNLEPTEYDFYKRRGHYKTAYKQFDKYYLFLERIVRQMLKPDGVCGLIVSRKFSHIESGKKIRGVLSRETQLTRLVDFGNVQLFHGRTTYSCLLYFSKFRPDDLDSMPLLYERIDTPQDWLRQYQLESRGIRLPHRYVSGENAWILPGVSAELDLLQAMSSNTVLLGDVADVFNGIQTSRNNVYVITDWEDDGADTITFMRQNRQWRIEKGILKPFYEGNVAELRSFYPLPTTALVIFPYVVDRVNGRLATTIIPPQTMQTDYPLAYAWLQHNQATLMRRDISPKPYPADEWYRFGRQQALATFENRAKIIVGVNSLGDKYVYDETNSLLASGGTAGECAIAAFQNKNKRSPYDLQFIHALLNHKAIEFFCRKRGSPFRGGWFARGTAVLKEIPIPNIDITTDNPRRQLYREITSTNQKLHHIGHTLNSAASASERKRLERQQRALKNKMDGMINQLYGIEHLIDQIELPT
ncbi:MAG: N-6 DNA methylase [Chloroflexi bacterium]|nr:N-6 DNA methylase [Chloroflexota bacterium]